MGWSIGNSSYESARAHDNRVQGRWSEDAGRDRLCCGCLRPSLFACAVPVPLVLFADLSTVNNQERTS